MLGTTGEERPPRLTRACGSGAPTVGALVTELAATLGAAGVPDARIEARDLVAAVLDMPRHWPALHREEIVGAETIGHARRAARARASGAPFAYAVGRAAFRHLTLDVDERVLIPRQETEMLVEAVLERFADAGSDWGLAVDVGTGSGAIALALAQEGRFARVIATDVSRGALAVAARNAARLPPAMRAAVELRQGAYLAPVVGERARLIVSNPPYIAHDEARELPASVRDWEPPTALFSAEGGMAATTRIVRDAAAVLAPGGVLALELDSRRAALAAELALADGRYRDVAVRLDLAGRERILLATRTHG
jgi:release factor glutamine methyltransferase